MTVKTALPAVLLQLTQLKVLYLLVLKGNKRMLPERATKYDPIHFHSVNYKVYG